MVYTIIIQLKNPRADLLAVKEAMAYYCERYGDLTFVDVTAQEPRQERIRKGKKTYAPHKARMSFKQ